MLPPTRVLRPFRTAPLQAPVRPAPGRVGPDQQRGQAWQDRARVLACLLLTAAVALTGCRQSDSAARIAQAKQYRAAGNTAAAVIELRAALQEDGANRHARLLLGEVCLEHGDAAAAEQQLRRARELGADPARIPLLLARAMLMQGKYEGVLADVDAQPKGVMRAEALSLRAEALLGLGSKAEAGAAYAQALAIDPGLGMALIGQARIAHGDGRQAEARQLAERALAVHPDDIELLRFLGDLLRAQGKPDAARDAYLRIVALRPQQARVLLDLANLHTDAGRFDLARASIARARTLAGPTVAQAYAEAALQFRENKLQASLDSLQQILGTAPDYYPAVLLAGAVQSAQGATQQARLHLQKFLGAYPGHLYASKLMSALMVRTGDTEDALALLRPLMQAHPADLELLTLAGEAHLQARRFGAAADLFERASAMRPALSSLHASLALSRLGNGEHGRAVAELERAAALDRRAARTGILLVMTQLRAQAPDKALAAVLAMETAGDNPLVQNLKGGVLLARQDAGGARACFERALALEALYLPALANLAQLDLREGKAAQARQRYEAALARAPRNLDLMDALSGLELSQGNEAAALAWLERAYRLAPASLAIGLRVTALSMRREQAAKALALAQSLRAHHPASTDALALLAQAHLLNQDAAAAQERYLQLAAMLPASPLPQLRLSQVHLAQGRQSEAIAALQRALALNPDLFEAQLSLVNIYIARRQFAEAQALANSAQRRWPRSPNGYKLEGDLLFAQQRFAPALAAYERAFALDSNSALLVQVHRVLGVLGRAAEADARLGQWLSKHPADVATRLYLASSRLVRLDLAGARTELEAVLALDPHNVLALNDLAWICQRQGDGRALALAERAFSLAPASAAVMDTLGWIYLDQGKLARALPLLHKASALAPRASDIHFHLVQALAKAGERGAARRELEKLLAAPGDFPRRAEAAALLAKL